MIKIITDPNFILSISFAIFLLFLARKIFRVAVASLDEKIAEIRKEINSSQKEFLDASTSLDDMNIENERIKQQKISLEKEWKEDLKHELKVYEELILKEGKKKLIDKEQILIKQKEETLADDIKQVTLASVDTFSKILQSDISKEAHSKMIDASIAKLKNLF